MSLESYRESLGDHAKDIRLNVSNILGLTTLTQQQLWGTIVACAIASKNKEFAAIVLSDAADKLSPEAINAAKAAVAVMNMNNIYYRSTHMIGKDYDKIPANLRMSIIANPGIDKIDFEMYALAVSAINGCDMCLRAHENTLSQHNVSKEVIQQLLRIAGIIHSAAWA
jgi:alkyl hydroperoxide reductase subunit D